MPFGAARGVKLFAQEPNMEHLASAIERHARDRGQRAGYHLGAIGLVSALALQAQGQVTQGCGLSTLAPFRALQARTPTPAWARRAVGEGVKSCPRDGCDSEKANAEIEAVRKTLQ
jgi:hypothetical protein